MTSRITCHEGWRSALLAAVCSLALSAQAKAEDPSATGVPAVAADSAPSDSQLSEQIAAAVRRGLPLVEQAAENYPAHRECFSCHHQTLPLLAVLSAGDLGHVADTGWMQGVIAHTHDSFDKSLKNLRAGTGIGGKGLTVAYGLWTFTLARRPADELTEAMVTFLLKTQEDDGHWGLHSVRPPMEESLAMCTVLAVDGIQRYATDSQQMDAKTALAKAKDWLTALVPESQEDCVARLWGLTILGAETDLIAAAQKTVLDAQRPDGGWSQNDTMQSDAYATGETIWVLRLAESAVKDSAASERVAAANRRGVQFLLKNQLEDGSWLVETRAKPVQIYFDNGDPHGKSQFISTTASSWALAALAGGRY